MLCAFLSDHGGADLCAPDADLGDSDAPDGAVFPDVRLRSNDYVDPLRLPVRFLDFILESLKNADYMNILYMLFLHLSRYFP